MHRSGHGLTLSATDLSNFLACRHRTALDMSAALGKRTYSYAEDPLLELLWERGLEHERRYVELLRVQHGAVKDLSQIMDNDARVAATLDAMRTGEPVIVQGALRLHEWFGRPDILRRRDEPSALGNWSYEVMDTKLAHETKAGTILQLSLYSEMLGAAQGKHPEEFHVVVPDDAHQHRCETYRVEHYAAYFRFVRDRMSASIALGDERLADENYPEPVEHCEICHWNGDCSARRRADDHLSLVANITRAQRRELSSHEVDTVAALATLPVPLPFNPVRGSRDAFVRAREQARLQHASRGRTPPLFETLPIVASQGLCRLPEPTPGDLFLDLEGDPFAMNDSRDACGREYLFGLVSSDGTYTAKWALTDRDERAAFEWVMDTIADAVRAHPGMHVYHYAAYEASAFKRLMGRYVTRERELDELLRAGRLVDLYAVVRQGLRAGIERYSIKSLEPLYEFHRAVALPEANRALRAMELALGRSATADLPGEVRQVVEGYNRDDCVSTLRLRDWLERVRRDLVASGTDVPRSELAAPDAPPDVDERARTVIDVRGKLLEGVPEMRGDRTVEQHSRWLLAYLLDYHRREDKATWWEYFRLVGLTQEALFDEREAIAGLAFVARVDQVLHKKTRKPTGTVIDRYRFPVQDVDVDRKDTLRSTDGKVFGKVDAIDRAARTIDIRKGPTYADVHPSAVFAFSHVDSEAMRTSLLRLGERVASGHDVAGPAMGLLNRDAPRLATGGFGAEPSASAGEHAVRIATELDRTVLAIQGPPGAGKTFNGARMVCRLVKAGKRVGVTATSHKVIQNFLDAVAKEADKQTLPVRLGHKVSDADDAPAGGRVVTFTDNDALLEALGSGDVQVAGGTAWLWSRDDYAGSIDVLVVDEAGQMSLANVVAVAQAANSVVLLGDPRQLEQPQKGSHPDGVELSALDHILDQHQTIPADRGIFLAQTWRLPPEICDFTSEVFYEGRLKPRAERTTQRVDGAAGLPSCGLALVEMEHDGNKNISLEEIDVVEDLVRRLTSDGVTCVDTKEMRRPMRGEDILVVAPYNSQVTRLTERLAARGVRIGTVDKFQGREAPVVIYSMATSTPDDAPRGMEFLYSLNRLNVATSRAECLAIVVASRALFEPECATRRQMELANGLCRFRELATSITRSSSSDASRPK